MKKVCFFLLLFGFLKQSQAQQKNIVWGYLKDSVTNESIVLASVTNLNRKHTVMTSNAGRFKIELHENEILSFAAVGYFFDTIQFHRAVFHKDTLMLYLSPLYRTISNVTVTSHSFNAYSRDSLQRRKEFLQDIVDYTIPAVSAANSGAGIAVNIDRFSKREKNKRKAFAFFETAEREAYIDYRIPAAIVTKYSGLKNEGLEAFMQLYRPSYEWLRQHNTEEDIKYYINEKLKLFNKKAQQ
jgi:hypothetical protein